MTGRPENTTATGDQRSAPRLTLLIRSAKIASPDGEYLCIVHNVSQNGVRLRLFHPLPEDADLMVEMPNGDRHAIDLIWQEDGRAGFRFREPQDVERIVACPSEFPKRPLRVAVEAVCELSIGDRWSEATLCNVSQHGAMIKTVERLALSQRLTIGIPGTRGIAARVCWRSGDRYGLSFEDTFQFGELASMVFRLQRGAAGSDRKAAMAS
jgi:hypothetical protein